MVTYYLKIKKKISTPLSFSTPVQGDCFRIYGKALRIPKLESSRQPIVKIWWF